MADDYAVLDGNGNPLTIAAKELSPGGPKSSRVTSMVNGLDVAAGNPVPSSLVPVTEGGCLVYRNLDLGATGQIVKASAGQLYGWYLFNAAASIRYLKIYNKASAPLQSDTPLYTIPIPAGAAANVAFPNGDAFSAGIGVRATTGLADNDTGAPSTNDVIVNLRYK